MTQNTKMRRLSGSIVKQMEKRQRARIRQSEIERKREKEREKKWFIKLEQKSNWIIFEKL